MMGQSSMSQEESVSKWMVQRQVMAFYVMSVYKGVSPLSVSSHLDSFIRC